MAAASPAASAIGIVPASNLCGGGANVEWSIQTLSIISPPPRNGGISSSSSRRPQSTPMPVGPHILWPVKPRKSAPSVVHVHRHVRHRLGGVHQHQRARPRAPGRRSAGPG